MARLRSVPSDQPTRPDLPPEAFDPGISDTVREAGGALLRAAIRAQGPKTPTRKA
jgi:hypothetical protein